MEARHGQIVIAVDGNLGRYLGLGRYKVHVRVHHIYLGRNGCVILRAIHTDQATGDLTTGRHSDSVVDGD